MANFTAESLNNSPLNGLPYSQEIILETLGLFRNEVVEMISVSEIVNVVSKDPAFTMRLLKIANSPVFSSGGVNSIEQAIFVLGIDTIRMIAMWILFYESSVSAIPVHILKKLREHSRDVAIATVIIGRTAQDRKFNHGVYFLAGLLHDVGRLLVQDSEYIAQLSNLIGMRGKDLLGLEKEIFNLTHTEQGKNALSFVNLPEEISLSAAYHHSYGEIQPLVLHDELVSSVYLAENILPFISVPLGCDGEWDFLCEKVMAKKKLKDTIILDIQQGIQKEEAFFA